MGPGIYSTIAADFAPQFWTNFWSQQGYIYPPFVLLFFSVFSGLGLGLFWVKAVFTICDLVSAYFIKKEYGWFAGFLVFAAPVTVWNGSHEGQFEPLLCVLLIAAIVLARKENWLLAGVLWALALHTKQFAILLVPFFAAQLIETARGTSRSLPLLRFAGGVVLGSLPFLPFYYEAPLLWFAAVKNQTLMYNPYHWDVWTRSHATWNPNWLTTWDGLSSYLTLGVTVLLMVRRSARPADAIKTSPLAAFTILLKSLNWGQFWYVIAMPAFVLALPPLRRGALMLLILYALFDGNSVMHLLGYRSYGPREHRETVDRFTECLFTCDYAK